MTVTGIIAAIVIGAIIGGLARLILPGKQNIPIWLTIVVGIVAALIGTFLARVLGSTDTDALTGSNYSSNSSSRSLPSAPSSASTAAAA